jgi:hypothetical protein
MLIRNVDSNNTHGTTSQMTAFFCTYTISMPCFTSQHENLGYEPSA